MVDSAHVKLDEVVARFETLEDPRSSINLLHPLPSVIVTAILAILAGANGPTSIAKWTKLKREFLQDILDFPNGVPGKDVFRRVLLALRPDAFQACFAEWLGSLRAAARDATGVDQPVLPIDGKTLRRSHDRKRDLGALHSVSVWASEYGLSLGQVACDNKSNEITAIPRLLEIVDARGAIITIDAMGTQKGIAKQIVEKGADYVLALKGNQETLAEAVSEYISDILIDDVKEVEVEKFEEEEKGHGRTEKRTYYQMRVPEGLAGASEWENLKTIGVACIESERGGVEYSEARYFISSLDLGVKRFARAVRGHWAIENSCHWSLDMTYREDESRIRARTLRENFAWLNRLTLSLLKQHPTKQSLVMKRRSCGWDDQFLLEVVTGQAG